MPCINCYTYSVQTKIIFILCGLNGALKAFAGLRATHSRVLACPAYQQKHAHELNAAVDV